MLHLVFRFVIIINFQIIPSTLNCERNIVFLLWKWWYNKITMMIWKLKFMVCTLGTLSDAINNRYTLTKFVQLFRHQYKVKCERLLHKKSDWNYYYLHVKFTRLYPHKSSFLLLMWVLRMSNHCKIIICIIIYTSDCFYFSFTMSVLKFWWLLFVAIEYLACKFSRLWINSCKQFTVSIDVYLIMEAVTCENL